MSGRFEEMGGGGLTPWVVEGSSRGREAWISPWAEVTESELRAAIVVVEELLLVRMDDFELLLSVSESGL